MKSEKIRVDGLSPEQIAGAEAKSKKYNSTIEQELFLAAGGTLGAWYGPFVSTVPAGFEREPAQDIVGLDKETRAIAYRMCAELMGELGSKLKRNEIVSLCKAARIIAKEPSADMRSRLEKYTVDRAFSMVADGE